MISEAFDERTKDNRRRAEVFRKGVVTAVDESGAFPLYTIAGRPMRMIQAGVVVGDVVVYADQGDPFGIGKFAGT